MVKGVLDRGLSPERSILTIPPASTVPVNVRPSDQKRIVPSVISAVKL